MTAYEIGQGVVTPGYAGCYEDGPIRAMDGEEKYANGTMTNEVRVQNIRF